MKHIVLCVLALGLAAPSAWPDAPIEPSET